MIPGPRVVLGIEGEPVYIPPPCPKCNGYGTHDGQPAPTSTAAALEAAAVSGLCLDCDGTGNARTDRDPLPF